MRDYADISFIVNKGLLIIGVELNAFKPERFYIIKFFFDILVVGVYSAE